MLAKYFIWKCLIWTSTIFVRHNELWDHLNAYKLSRNVLGQHFLISRIMNLFWSVGWKKLKKDPLIFLETEKMESTKNQMRTGEIIFLAEWIKGGFIIKLIKNWLPYVFTVYCPSAAIILRIDPVAPFGSPRFTHLFYNILL